MRPSPGRKTVASPESVLDGKPGEEATLRWGPRRPDEAVEVASCGTEELCFISRIGRVDPVRREGPDDAVRRIRKQHTVLKPDPEVDELPDVGWGE